MGWGKYSQAPQSKNDETVNESPLARNLPTKDLGAVIFGCKHHTFSESMDKKIFGLPSPHYSYVKNITAGLPLFLFNYSDRMLHGIFEAKSCGQRNVDGQAWASCEGVDYTPYPAQVRMDYRTRCQPLSEEKFKPVIHKNYYEERLFWFELDKGQTSGLIQLFLSSPLPGNVPRPPVNNMIKALSISDSNVTADHESQNLDMKPSVSGKWSDLFTPASSSHQETSELPLEAACSDALDVVGDLPQDLLFNEVNVDSWSEHEEPQDLPFNEVNVGVLPTQSSSDPSLNKMTEVIEGLKFNQIKQRLKMDSLEQELVHSKLEIDHLKKRCHILESHCFFKTDQSNVRGHDTYGESVFIVGGYDGHSCLLDLSLYSPLTDTFVSRCPMSYPRLGASVAKLNGQLFIIGGKSSTHEGVWYDTVESYNLVTDKWIEQPSLSKKKGSMAVASLYETIFAMGGGNGDGVFSDVELLDLSIGSWMSTQSMLEKRTGAAAAHLNGALYVTGGFDGNDYLSSVERFDPRKHGWSRVGFMNSKRGSHSLVVLKDELYALGGYDGVSVVPTVEVFDPRIGSWMLEESMTVTRVNFGSFVSKGRIYVIGGMVDNCVSDVIECYEGGSGWQVTGNTRLGKRSCFSALVF